MLRAARAAAMAAFPHAHPSSMPSNSVIAATRNTENASDGGSITATILHFKSALTQPKNTFLYTEKKAACPIVSDVFLETINIVVAANATQHRIHVFMVRLDLNASATHANGPGGASVWSTFIDSSSFVESFSLVICERGCASSA